MNPDDITFLEEQAIQSTVKKHWNKAISFNKEILRQKPKHLPTLNRLGLAYIKTQKLKKAKEVFDKALKINSNHPITIKNLKTLKNCKKSNFSPTLNDTEEDFLHSFIEIPGSSRNVPIIKSGEPETITNLEIGQPLKLKISARKVKILTLKNKYVGCLPDNLSLRFIKLLNSGYKYSIHLKSNHPQNLQVFIEEIKRSKRLKGVPTFPTKGDRSLSLESSKQPNIPPLEIYDPLTKED